LYGSETWSLTLREAHRFRVFESRVLRTIFEPTTDEVTGGWRKLHNEELHNLYSLPNTINRMTKSRRIRWIGHVAHMGKMRNAYKILLEILKGRDRSEDLGVDGMIILKWILGRQSLRAWIGFICLR
jgi:hypothetical protein